MRLALHTVICCCVFTTVLPLVKGATGELNTSLKKRFKVWLHSRLKRDLCSDLETANEQHLNIHVGQQQDEIGEIDPSLSGFGLNMRPRRSTATKSSGCLLMTCAYHDLLHRLRQISEQKETNAPEKKMSSTGYGRRRRRSLLDVAQLALQTGRQRQSTEAGQRVHRHTRTVA
ncbi:pro-adrenomedullin [Plectropomus leopardus]|uniref:pro-adrenomedullin n=1 Tax=Plectropomus leopardus TaxID=160734 RepID=UPI001C4DB6A1|nr:pro-adrenomedullin [Plectropomus leopardus]